MFNCYQNTSHSRKKLLISDLSSSERNLDKNRKIKIYFSTTFTACTYRRRLNSFCPQTLICVCVEVVINDVSWNLTFKKFIYHQLVPVLDDGPLELDIFCCGWKQQLSVRRLIVDNGAVNPCSQLDVWDQKTLIILF